MQLVRKKREKMKLARKKLRKLIIKEMALQRPSQEDIIYQQFNEALQIAIDELIGSAYPEYDVNINVNIDGALRQYMMEITGAGRGVDIRANVDWMLVFDRDAKGKIMSIDATGRDFQTTDYGEGPEYLAYNIIMMILDNINDLNWQILP